MTDRKAFICLNHREIVAVISNNEQRLLFPASLMNKRSDARTLVHSGMIEIEKLTIYIPCKHIGEIRIN